MHAILTNPNLNDVVAWAPHGRSWCILKPREFEIRVLPKYFEHSKFSSFVRQANGWGFRRLSQGHDRNAYYHEYFLRGMPWLCKKMRRPKVAEKKPVDPELEPDFYAISAQFPVPDKPPGREIQIVQRTMEEGPRARMPVHWVTSNSPSPPCVPHSTVASNLDDKNNFAKESPFQSSTSGIGYVDLKTASLPNITTAIAGNNAEVAVGDHLQKNPQCNAFNFTSQSVTNLKVNSNSDPRNNNTLASSSLFSDSQFAAGFMVATAYHSYHIRNMLGNAFMHGMPIPDAFGSLVGNPTPQAGDVAAFAREDNHLDHILRPGMGIENNFYLPGNSAAVTPHAASNKMVKGGARSSFSDGMTGKPSF